jgi:hypothetical protein
VEVSARRYATMRGVSREAIRDAIKRGVIVRNAAGKNVVEDADETCWQRREAWKRAGEAAAGGEDRRLKAELRRTLAKLLMTRRKIERTRARLAHRNGTQREVGEAIMELHKLLGQAAHQNDEVQREVIGSIRLDLGDLTAEALKVTRL